MAAALTLTLPADSQQAGWNFRHLVCAYILGFILQGMFVPCLCNIGEAKMTYTFVLDVLVALRILVAFLIRERGRGWIFYAVLMYTSAGWIEIVSRIVLGPDGW